MYLLSGDTQSTSSVLLRGTEIMGDCDMAAVGGGCTWQGWVKGQGKK